MTYLEKNYLLNIFVWINEFTLSGWIKNIDEKNPVRSDVNHFWVFKSPNWIPRTIIKNIEIPANINDKPYAINKHHQGNVTWDRFFLVDWIVVSLEKQQSFVIYLDFYIGIELNNLRHWLLFYFINCFT